MNPRGRLIGLVGIVVAVGLSITLGAQPPMTELRGDGFSLRASIPLDKLPAVACDLDTAVRVVGRPPDGTPTPTVVAVENARGTREWLPQFEGGKAANLLGAYWQGLFGHHIVVRVDTRPDERFRRVLHEYAHFMTHLAHPEPPRWLDEGLSELWEHTAIRPDGIELGVPVAAHVQRLHSDKGWIPVKDLLSAHDIPATNAPSFYAQAWGVAHYLMTDTPSGPLVADVAQLPTDDELKAYVRGPMTKRVVRSTFPSGRANCSYQGPVRAVPHLESLLTRAKALADGEWPDAALPLLQEAVARDPASVDALETVGYVHFKGNRPVEAAATFDGVIATGKGTHVSFYYRAVLADPVPTKTDGTGPIPPVEYLRKAVALSPGFTQAVERLRQLSGKK